MAYAHVAHDCRLGNQIILANCATLGGHVDIGDWAILGGLSAAHQFTKIGAHAFIAHNTMVTRDVPPYVMAVGRPAVPHSINVEGLTRRGFTTEQIRNIRRAYRVLYRSGLKLQEALEQLDRSAESRPNYGRSSNSSTQARAVWFARRRMSGPLRVALVAGEASGDTLGAGLIQALRRRRARCRILRRCGSQDASGRLRGVGAGGVARRHGTL